MLGGFAYKDGCILRPGSGINLDRKCSFRHLHTALGLNGDGHDRVFLGKREA